MVHTVITQITTDTIMNIMTKIDIHSHILYGVDDGSRTLDESIELLKQARDVGYKKILTTPHFPSGTFDEEKFEILQKKANELEIELYRGREVMLLPESIKNLSDKLSIDKTKYILIELPSGMVYSSCNTGLKSVMRMGYSVVLAHVERYGFTLEQVRKLRELGIVIQGNIRSMKSKVGRELLKNKYIDVLASDSHRGDGRNYELQGDFERLEKMLGVEELERLVKINPLKVLLGEEVVRVEEREKNFFERLKEYINIT